MFIHAGIRERLPNTRAGLEEGDGRVEVGRLPKSWYLSLSINEERWCKTIQEYYLYMHQEQNMVFLTSVVFKCA